MMIDRRTLLAGAAGTVALSYLGLPIRAASAAQIKAVGLQLYTVREIFEKDPAGTLENIAKIGYREVEFGGGGFDKMDPAMLRKTMDRVGLKSPSAHISYDALLGDFDKSAAMAKTLGAETIVLPYMTDDHRNEAGWTEALTNINRIGEKVKKAGFGFAYHNHDFEFTTKPGGVSLYERLLKGVSPSLLKLELDLYWAVHAGEDAAAWIERLGSRLYAFHVKDMHADKSMAAVGTGTIDFAALFKLKGAAGVRHFYVENDQAAAPYLPDITTSFENLRKLRF